MYNKFGPNARKPLNFVQKPFNKQPIPKKDKVVKPKKGK